MNPQRVRALIAAAKQAQKRAFCPASSYPVGAAVLGESGRVYVGCNIEPPTLINHICAERAAIAGAISHGERRIKAVCTVSRASVPCGACRQFIREFGDEDTNVISICLDPANHRQRIVQTTIGELLPQAHTEATIHPKGGRAHGHARPG